MTRQHLRPLAFPIFMIKLYNLVIWKEQVYCILWERLPAAIVLIRGWKPLPQVSFLVTWTYRISALGNLVRLAFWRIWNFYLSITTSLISSELALSSGAYMA